MLHGISIEKTSAKFIFILQKVKIKSRQHKRKKLTFRASQSLRIDCSSSKSFNRIFDKRSQKGLQIKGVPAKSQDFVGKSRQHKRYFLPLALRGQKQPTARAHGEIIAYAHGVNERRHLSAYKNAAANDTESEIKRGPRK